MLYHSKLMIENVENIGFHYARTLREWRQRFQEDYHLLHKPEWDEAFRRKWQYYFSYCEAAFETRTLADLQIVLTRPNNQILDNKPGHNAFFKKARPEIVLEETESTILVSNNN